jgi:hypothetical protein
MTTSVFIPIMGGLPDFDVFVAGGEEDERPFGTFRKLDFPNGVFDPPDRLKKFHRDEYTLTYATQMISRPSFELEYYVAPDQFEKSHALLIVFFQLLMIKTGCRLGAPCFANHSLTIIDTLGPKDMEIKVFNGEDTTLRRYGRLPVTKDHLQWTVENLYHIIDKIDQEERLLMAFQSINAERFAHSPPMSLLTLWSGLEALFSIDQEQTFRLSLMVAYYLETESVQRQQLFDQMRDAYKIRSAVTHGRRKTPATIIESINFVTAVLRRCILHAAETGQLPSTKTLFFP